MLIYSIYPSNVIFPDKEEERRYFTMDLAGRTLILELKDGQAQVVRLLSPDPSDYLNPSFQPGSTVTFAPPK